MAEPTGPPAARFGKVREKSHARRRARPYAPGPLTERVLRHGRSHGTDQRAPQNAALTAPARLVGTAGEEEQEKVDAQAQCAAARRGLCVEKKRRSPCWCAETQEGGRGAEAPAAERSLPSALERGKPRFRSGRGFTSQRDACAGVVGDPRLPCNGALSCSVGSCAAALPRLALGSCAAAFPPPSTLPFVRNWPAASGRGRSKAGNDRLVTPWLRRSERAEEAQRGRPKRPPQKGRDETAGRLRFDLHQVSWAC